MTDEETTMDETTETETVDVMARFQAAGADATEQAKLQPGDRIIRDRVGVGDRRLVVDRRRVARARAKRGHHAETEGGS